MPEKVSRRPRFDREKDIIDAVALYWRRHGRPPTMAAIAELCEMRTTGYMQEVCSGLVRRGVLAKAGTHGYMVSSDQEIVREALRGKAWR